MTKTKLLSIAALLVFLGAACTPGAVQTEADGGVWVTQNKGETWEHRSTIFADRTSKKTIGSIDIKEIIFSSDDPDKVFAISDRAGLWVSWNKGHFWDLILSNMHITDIAIHPDNPKVIYAAIGSTIVVSGDQGIHWRSIYTSDDSSILITSIVLNPNNPNILLAATDSGDILISEDSGTFWRIYSSLGSVVLTDMEFHPTIQKTIYALVKGKGLVRSLDEGKNWEFFDEAFTEFAGTDDGRDFVLVPSGVVYASAFGLLRSLNHGKDWLELPLISGSHNANIYSLVVDPVNPLEVTYGTRSTLYHSIDGGFNWIPRMLPTTRTATELKIHPENPDLLYLGVSLAR